jgi:hypothetical protein
VKNRISRFDPECQPEAREREDPSIQLYRPNQIIRESWHFGALRDNFPYCVVVAIRHSPPARLACVAGEFALPKLVCAERDCYLLLFLTAYCVLRTVAVGFVS